MRLTRASSSARSWLQRRKWRGPIAVGAGRWSSVIVARMAGLLRWHSMEEQAAFPPRSRMGCELCCGMVTEAETGRHRVGTAGGSRPVGSAAVHAVGGQVAALAVTHAAGLA